MYLHVKERLGAIGCPDRAAAMWLMRQLVGVQRYPALVPCAPPTQNELREQVHEDLKGDSADDNADTNQSTIP